MNELMVRILWLEVMRMVKWIKGCDMLHQHRPCGLQLKPIASGSGAN
jgi:hypothetical protein